jgi:thiol:disulfide interchange protein
MDRSLRRVENLHIAFWLLKDLGWVQDIHLLGVIMVIPTLSMAIWLTWQMRHERSELAHNTAVCCWIIANAIWMMGEFFLHDSTRPQATIFFCIGLSILLVHYCAEYLKRNSPSVVETNQSNTPDLPDT